MIDLHLHTTASDGRHPPPALVALAASHQLQVIAAADHDTTAGIADLRTHAAAAGIEVVPGIEITAVEDERDVHVLGYFFDAGDPALQRFLEAQRASRVTRIEEIVDRLASLGLPLDRQAIAGAGVRASEHSIGRPQVARAMIAAGYVTDVQDAFSRWLGRGCPAFVPRRGPSIESVIAVIHEAHGLASLAHPGRTAIDARIDALCDAGLDALEAFHPDHDPAAVAVYAGVARRRGLLLTGGSDFHGDAGRVAAPGATVLPAEHWQALSLARDRHR